MQRLGNSGPLRRQTANTGKRTPTAPESEVEIDQAAEDQPVTNIPDDNLDSDGAAGEKEAEESPAQFRRVANQNGLAVGEERLFCDTCGSGFAAIIGEQPGQCPEGHAPQAVGNWVNK